MAGIHKPTTGVMEVNGRVSALLELGSGFSPGAKRPRKHLPQRSNSWPQPQGNGPSCRRNHRIQRHGKFIDAPVKILSSGMYVRLGFAVAVHVAPEILLIDEVIAVGDEAFQRKCLEHLYELSAAGTTPFLYRTPCP